MKFRENSNEYNYHEYSYLMKVEIFVISHLSHISMKEKNSITVCADI